MANTATYITPGANQDITSRVLTNDYQTPAFASTIALKPTAYRSVYKPATLTGAVTFTADTSTATFGIGSELLILMTADGSGPYTVTFGTGFKSPGTISVAASKFGRASFTFDGTNWVGSGVATA